MTTTTTTKREVARQFGKTAEAYARSPGHASGADLQVVLALLQPHANMTVVDIATGAGHTALTVAPHVACVIATDLAPEMIQETTRLRAERKIENLVAAVMDAERIALCSSGCDAVTCRIAPHHFMDVAAFLREVSRVLRPGGVFVLEDSCSPEDPGLDAFINKLEARRDPTHVRAYTEGEWRTMLGDVNVEVDTTQIYRKTHAVEDWLARADASTEARTRVYAHLSDASPLAREHFAMTFEGERATSYTDDKLVLRAVKR